MRVKVGQVLRWRGKRWFIARLDNYESILEATESSSWATEGRMSNVVYLNMAVQDYDEGDVILRREQKIMLAGLDSPDTAYIVGVLRIKKLRKGRYYGERGSVGAATSEGEPAEAAWGEPGSWTSSWLEGIGETSDPADGPGSVQSDAGNPGAPPEGVHPTPDYGSSGGGGSTSAEGGDDIVVTATVRGHMWVVQAEADPGAHGHGDVQQDGGDELRPIRQG